MGGGCKYDTWEDRLAAVVEDLVATWYVQDQDFHILSLLGDPGTESLQAPWGALDEGAFCVLSLTVRRGWSMCETHSSLPTRSRSPAG